jgi:LPPG:FO 2-phospho-L-lactate transferase
LLTKAGWIEFQDYFVRRRCEPVVKEIAFVGAEVSTPAPAVLAALNDKDVQAVVICPSNPLVSIEPILAVPGIREALASCTAPVIAVSPIIGGRALRGPTVKLMRELGLDSSATGVAERYAGLIDGWVVDEADAESAVPSGVERIVTKTLMISLEDRERLALDVLAAARRLAAAQSTSGVAAGAAP